MVATAQANTKTASFFFKMGGCLEVEFKEHLWIIHRNLDV